MSDSEILKHNNYRVQGIVDCCARCKHCHTNVRYGQFAGFLCGIVIKESATITYYNEANDANVNALGICDKYEAE